MTIVGAPGGGNWSAGATWVGGVAPTAADDVQLDATSGNVTIDAGAVCRSFDCTGYTGVLTHNAGVTLNIGDATAGAGNKALKLVPGMTYTLNNTTTSAIAFISTSATPQTIDMGGKTTGAITINGAGGSWQLAADAACNGTFTHTAGAFDAVTFNVTAAALSSSNSNVRTLSLGTGTWTLTSSGTPLQFSTMTNLTLNYNTSTILLSDTSASNKTIAHGSTLDLYHLTIAGGGTGQVNFGANVVRVNGAFTVTGPKTIQFTAGGGSATVFNGAFNVSGTPGNLVTLKSGTPGTRAVLQKPSGVTNCDYLSITDIQGSLGAYWAAGANSTNGGNNLGWVFDSPAKMQAAFLAAV